MPASAPPERAYRGLEAYIAVFSAGAIVLALVLEYALRRPGAQIPLYAAIIAGGAPLLFKIVARFAQGELGSDLLAGVSIVTAAAMRQPLVGAILVLMLSGGGALEEFAARRASSVLDALARRMPQLAHRRVPGGLEDVPVERVAVADTLVVLPHELCPVDGTVVEGRGTMDESYLTGEPFQISKTPGSPVLSGAVNGESALTIVAGKLARDSRYASIMGVMAQADANRPRLRRLADRLAAWYTPLALVIAVAAWLASSNPSRFLAVLVVATPCPLLIAIPVAVIGAISLSAARGIVIKDPTVLEKIETCRTVILDKTGTLTVGRPTLVEIIPADGVAGDEALRLAAGLERYSRHPLAAAVLDAARQRGLSAPAAANVSERPGLGLTGTVDGRAVWITGRKSAPEEARRLLPAAAQGLECLVLVDGAAAAVLRFRDVPRPESGAFLSHLSPTHRVTRLMLLSGDRESEVRYLADQVGIKEIAAGKSPEEKLAIVREETAKGSTLFIGDGINDAPALAAATVGVAIGAGSDVTSEAAGAVIMTAEIAKLDELIHIGQRMRKVALQSALGGMSLSLLGMCAAAFGLLPPVAGAVAQELIDLAAVLNAIRAAFPPARLTDF